MSDLLEAARGAYPRRIILVNYRGDNNYGIGQPAGQRSGSILVIGCQELRVINAQAKAVTVTLGGVGFELSLAKEPACWDAASRRCSPDRRQGAMRLPVGWGRLSRVKGQAPIVASREPIALTNRDRRLVGRTLLVGDHHALTRALHDALKHIGLEGAELLSMRDRLVLQTNAGVRRFGI